MEELKYSKKTEKNASDERYWYFRFPEDFFDDDAILETETLINNTGYIYIVILLKIYCLTVRAGGTFTIPATPEGGIDYVNIGHRIRFNDLNVLRSAINHLNSVGLLYISNDPVAPPFATEPVMMTTIYAPHVENMTGSIKPSSDNRRLQRAEKKALTERKQITDAPKVKADDEKLSLGTFKNIRITEDEYLSLKEMTNNVDKIIDAYSLDKFAFKESDVADYDVLLRRAALEKQRKQENVALQIEMDEKKEIPTGSFNNVKLTAKEWEKLRRQFTDPEKLVDHISERIHTHDYKMPSHYAFAVKCGKEDGWETVAQRMEKEAAEVASKMKQAENEEKADAEKDAEMIAYYTQKARELGVDTWQQAADIMRERLKKGEGLAWKPKTI